MMTFLGSCKYAGGIQDDTRLEAFFKLDSFCKELHTVLNTKRKDPLGNIDLKQK
jgi:hypothetical protein